MSQEDSIKKVAGAMKPRDLCYVYGKCSPRLINKLSSHPSFQWQAILIKMGPELHVSFYEYIGGGDSPRSFDPYADISPCRHAACFW